VLAPEAVVEEVLEEAAEPFDSLAWPSERPPAGAEGGAPGSPANAELAGGTPTGGAAFGFCAFIQVWNALGVTTCTAARKSECPAPHSSVHSTG
jgi:hypothetical protein